MHEQQHESLMMVMVMVMSKEQVLKLVNRPSLVIWFLCFTTTTLMLILGGFSPNLANFTFGGRFLGYHRIAHPLLSSGN